MNGLPTAELGRTGVTVTRLGYGTMGLAGGGKSSRARDITPAEAGTVLNAVLDAGINLIDTSPDYGEAEAAIGAAIAHRRDEYFLASKCGCPVNQPPPPPGERQPHVFTRQNVRAGVEQSLARMRTDHLDLVQIHHSPSRQVLERDDSLAELEALRDEGKVRFIGMSATLPHIEDHIDMGVFDTFQIPYSVVEPDHQAWISNAAEAGAGTIVRGGVARGVTAAATLDVDGLTGPSQASLTKKWELWTRAGLVDLLGDSMTPVEFMLRATLAHPDLTTTIVGTASRAHLADNVAAALAGPLPDDVYQEVKRRVAVYQEVKRRVAVYQEVKRRVAVYQEVKRRVAVYQEVKRRVAVYQEVKRRVAVYQEVKRRVAVYQEVKRRVAVYQEVKRRVAVYQEVKRRVAAVPG